MINALTNVIAESVIHVTSIGWGRRNKSDWWRLNFVPQLDLSVPMAWTWRLFSWIYWLYQLPTYTRTLEIAWWWRRGAVIMSSWRTWNILVKRAGSERRLEFQTWNWYYSSHACKLANTPMHLPPFGIYLLTFDEFHRVSSRVGRKFIDCIQFLWGFQQDCRRSTLLREGDDGSAWRQKQEYSICFSSIMYMCKKLLLGRWCKLVHSMKLSSHNHLQWLERDYRWPRPYWQIVASSVNSQVSHSTTATTHRIPLDTHPEGRLWECYWVRDYLLSYRPWLFVEVDDRRDLR